MPRLQPDARDQGLGARLRDCRQKTGMTQSRVCEHLHWDKSALSRLEGGLRQISLADVAQLVGLYGVHGDLRDDLLAAARNQDDALWCDFAAPGHPIGTVMLAEYESSATAMTDWAPLLMPGMLQTQEFAEAWLTHVGAAQTNIGPIWDSRRKRQRILNGPVHYRAYVGEGAFRVMVGSPSVMANQLAHLRRMQERRNVTVRIVPAHVSAQDGQLVAFLALEFAQAKPMVVLELPQAGVYQDRHRQTAPYFEILRHLDAVALGEKESAGLMQRMQVRWSEVERREMLA